MTNSLQQVPARGKGIARGLVGATLLLSCVTLAACSGPSDDPVSSRLTVCVDPSFPPLESLDNGNPVGFDIDLATAVAAQMGKEITFQQGQFDGLLPSVSSGRCDVAWSGMFITDERTEAFPAVPYMSTGMVVMVASGNPAGITSPEDLSGKTVATQAGTDYPARLQELSDRLVAAGEAPPIVQTYPKDTDAVQQLTVGRADAVLTQDTEAAYRQVEAPDQFEIAYHYPASDTFGIYYSKSDAELGTALESALAALKDDGTLAELAEKYDLSPDQLIVG